MQSIRFDSLRRILPQVILDKAKYLGVIGVDDFAWDSHDAIDVVDILFAKKIFILGGDVYEPFTGGIKPTGDSWNMDAAGYLPTQDEIDMSRQKSIDYITNYITRNGSNFLFTIVPFIR